MDVNTAQKPGSRERLMLSNTHKRRLLLLLAVHKTMKVSRYYTLTLKIKTAMFAETSDNFQYSTPHIPEGRSFS
jgi:hypothetical protein